MKIFGNTFMMKMSDGQGFHAFPRGKSLVRIIIIIIIEILGNPYEKSEIWYTSWQEIPLKNKKSPTSNNVRK